MKKRKEKKLVLKKNGWESSQIYKGEARSKRTELKMGYKSYCFVQFWEIILYHNYLVGQHFISAKD